MDTKEVVIAVVAFALGYYLMTHYGKTGKAY